MPSNTFRYALITTAALSLSACGINSVPTAEENAKQNGGNVEAAFQRRANLIPNLAEIVKGAAAAENKTLTDVIEARAKATSPTIKVNGDDLTDPAKIAAFQAAQGQLSGSLSRLLATVESYPELKSQEGFLQFQSQLEGTENRINITIQDYNEAVRGYNTTIRTFPDIIGAKVIHGAKPLASYQATTQGAEEAPKLDMTPTG